jgi:UDP-N-acetylglucosamine transferase subunit ALG13
MGEFVGYISQCYLWGEYILIFVCLGTKRFSFNRLLQEIDSLILSGEIEEKVFAQVGSSTYAPVNFEFSNFLTSEEYEEKVKNSSIIITHGGTGAIVKGLKASKQVIAIPRLSKYGEHSDDHQLQIVDFFEERNLIKRIDEVSELKFALTSIKRNPITERFEGKGNVIGIIDDFINL